MSWVPGIVAAALLVWFVATYNVLVRLRNQHRNAWHQIDVQVKRRYDLVPNLVEVVKDYLTFEQETLRKVVEARGAAAGASGPAARGRAENVLTESLRQLFALVESYPELKSNGRVAALQEELTATENRISFSRQFYNDAVMTYNNRIQAIPANLIASVFDFAPAEHFGTGADEARVPLADLR